MAERQRYTRKKKVAAVMAAAASSTLAAAEAHGIPESTLRSWLDKPEFAKLRDQTREDLAEEMKGLAHLATARLAELIGQMKPGDLVLTATMGTNFGELLTGGATSRTESRDLTDNLDDHEREKLRDAIDRILNPQEVE